MIRPAGSPMPAWVSTAPPFNMACSSRPRSKFWSIWFVGAAGRRLVADHVGCVVQCPATSRFHADLGKPGRAVSASRSVLEIPRRHGGGEPKPDLTDLIWAMTYAGYPNTSGFNKIGAGAGAVAKHAAQSLRGGVYWMGNK